MKKKKWSLIFKGKIEDFDSSHSLDYWASRTTSEKFKVARDPLQVAEVDHAMTKVQSVASIVSSFLIFVFS